MTVSPSNPAPLAYKVLEPDSIPYWFILALIADRRGQAALREAALAEVSSITQARLIRRSAELEAPNGTPSDS